GLPPRFADALLSARPGAVAGPFREDAAPPGLHDEGAAGAAPWRNRQPHRVRERSRWGYAAGKLSTLVDICGRKSAFPILSEPVFRPRCNCTTKALPKIRQACFSLAELQRPLPHDRSKDML